MRRMKKRWMAAGLLVPLLLLFAAAWPVYSQGSSLKQLLDGKDVPTSVKAKELTTDYRVVKAGDNQEVTVMQMRMFGWQALTALGGVYYTKGETIKIGDTTYLIGYRATEDPQELQRRMRNHNVDPNDNPFEPRKLVSNETLTLSLLNLRTIGSLNDVRPFDPERDVMSEAEHKAQRINRANQESTQNMRQVGLALKQYLSDYDEKIPPMNPATSFRQIEQGLRRGVTKNTPVHVVLQPYVRNTELFRHPVTKEIYRPNQSLSFKDESEIDLPNEIAMFYEGSPAPDGTRAVVFMDGHVQRVQETDWPRIRKVSGMAPNGEPLPKPRLVSRAERLAQANSISEKNLRQIGLALLQYVQDYDETLPPMRPATSFRQIEQGLRRGNGITVDTPVQVRLYPYVRRDRVFRHPVTQDIYRPNQSLSFKSVTEIDRPADVAMFYEGKPAADGRRAVLFMDGHVQRIRETEWPRLAMSSGIALPKRTVARKRARAVASGRGSPARRVSRSRRARR